MMQSDENRIQKIEAEAQPGMPNWTLVLAFCEIARQLSRLADAYEEAHK